MKSGRLGCSMLRKHLVFAGRSSVRLVMTQFPLSLASYNIAASSSPWFTIYPPPNTHLSPQLLCWLCPFKYNLALQREADQASLEPYLLSPFVLGLCAEVNCRDSVAGG